MSIFIEIDGVKYVPADQNTLEVNDKLLSQLPDPLEKATRGGRIDGTGTTKPYCLYIHRDYGEWYAEYRNDGDNEVFEQTSGATVSEALESLVSTLRADGEL